MIFECFAENWPSGRRRTLGKRVRGQLLRGFESLVLRHNKEARIPSFFIIERIKCGFEKNERQCQKASEE